MTEKPTAAAPFPAALGAGPLLQREYWTALPECDTAPEEIISRLRQRFVEFANPLIADFSLLQDAPLEVGHELAIRIQGYGTCHVRVIHRDAQSLTLLTLDDHYEAGRITFGAYVENGVLTVKIRSRSRTRSVPHFWGFAAGGHRVQKELWLQFIGNIARECGVDEAQVHEQSEEVTATLADSGELNTPTFIAKRD